MKTEIEFGRTPVRVTVPVRTVAAVKAAAAKALTSANVEDLRHLSEWTGWTAESFWIPEGSRDLSIVGIIQVLIACLVVDVDFPERIEDPRDRRFVERVYRYADRVT